MNDERLYEQMQRGAPVAHCRAKIAHDRELRLREDRRACEASHRSRPILSVRWAA